MSEGVDIPKNPTVEEPQSAGIGKRKEVSAQESEDLGLEPKEANTFRGQ